MMSAGMLSPPPKAHRQRYTKNRHTHTPRQRRPRRLEVQTLWRKFGCVCWWANADPSCRLPFWDQTTPAIICTFMRRNKSLPWAMTDSALRLLLLLCVSWCLHVDVRGTAHSNINSVMVFTLHLVGCQFVNQHNRQQIKSLFDVQLLWQLIKLELKRLQHPKNHINCQKYAGISTSDTLRKQCSCEQQWTAFITTK